MTDLPSGWEWATLQDLAAPEPRAITDGPFGSNLKSSHYVDSGPRVIRLQNIGFGEFIDEEAHIADEHFESLRDHEARPGDLVVASLGQDLPRACLVPPHLGPAIVKADCIRVRLHPGLDGRYVSYALQRPELRHAVADQIHGVGRPRLGMAGIKQLSVPVVPRAEQERIVAAIEEHLSRLDAAEVATGSARQRLSGFYHALLHDMFDPGWSRETLDSVNDSERPICYGILKPKTPEPGKVPYVEVRSIAKGHIKVDELHRTTLALHQEFRRSELRAGDVTLAIRGSFDRAAVVPDELTGANVSRDVARIAPANRLLPEFLAAFLVSPEARRYFRVHARGVAVQGINIGDLRRLPVPLPSTEQQQQAVGQIEEARIGMDHIDREVLTAELRGAQLRRSVLAAAFSGQLVPQDPNDEPASVLLERIQAERSATAPKKRTQKARAS